MSSIDNIVCWGTGILSGAFMTLFTEFYVNNHIKTDFTGDLHLDALLAGPLACFFATGISYKIRNYLFYRTISKDYPKDKYTGTEVTKTIDIRSGETIERTVTEYRIGDTHAER